MGKLTPLSYRHGNFVLFNMDVRCKLICICVLSIIIIKTNFLHLCLLNITLLWLLYRCDVNIQQFIKEIKHFFLILFFVFIVRSITLQGENISIPTFPLIKSWNINGVDININNIITYININILPYSHITKEGIVDGFKVSWRFLTIMIMGILFSSSTTASSIKSAVIILLKPIPFIPEKRVGIMVSLFIRFLPMLLEKASEVSDAQKSRCFHLQKNPVKKIKNLTVPLLTKVFYSADTLAIAMASRCYSDNRVELTDINFLYSGYEIYFYVGTLAVCAIVLFF